MYDRTNWIALIGVLNSDNHAEVHPLNKVQLIKDAYNFAKTDRLVSQTDDCYLDILSFHPF
jgi:hypothetical protein